MPILQSRLLRILEAAEEYKRNFQMLRGTINRICIRAARNELDPKSALAEIQFELEIAKDVYAADVVMGEERARYNLTYRDNLVKARIMQKRRDKQREEGLITPTRRPPRQPDVVERSVIQRGELEADIDDTAGMPEVPDDEGESDPKFQEFLQQRRKQRGENS